MGRGRVDRLLPTIYFRSSYLVTLTMSPKELPVPEPADPAVELLKILPELAVTLYRAAPHDEVHAAPPGAAAVTPRQWRP